jgi:SAM-dependent methyltransferase
MFRHGDMIRPQYANEVFHHHYDRVRLPERTDGIVGLELGPGDSLASALIGRSHGFERVWLMDVGEFAGTDLEPYRELERFLRGDGLNTPDIASAETVPELLSICRADYLTEGIASLQRIPDESVDFIWSQAVLEHIRRDEFPGLLTELRRVIRSEGVCSHRVDLRDHIGGALNNLRFSHRVWESRFMVESGFYTNRIQFSEMLDLFKGAGVDAEVVQIDRWNDLPTPREKLAEEFSEKDDDELRVFGFDVILSPE